MKQEINKRALNNDIETGRFHYSSKIDYSLVS